MAQAVSLLGTASRTTSYVLGVGVIGLAVVSATGAVEAGDFVARARQVFGPAFCLLYVALVSTVLFCQVRLGQLQHDPIHSQPWLEAGMHAASGIATLALTFTLLGISLGIGSLADQPLTSDTIQTVIQGLTGHFSMAFMTTVVGLPTAAGLRALLQISQANRSAAARRVLPYHPGEK
jgi:tellurite resistance protein TehA-like permease